MQPRQSLHNPLTQNEFKIVDMLLLSIKTKHYNRVEHDV